MRLAWYSATSAALATGVVAYAFNQRANFYSAMVYLSQNNLSLMIIINLVLLVYGSFVWGLQRLCYGPLRPIEVEQLYEKAWFAVTETCLAMTIFREEVGAWFLVMFTALVTGKVWQWIGEGRVEVLEQQPPANPRLFHTRLSVSLLVSMAYDAWLLVYTIRSVIQQARPNMMVMFLFEFAILGTSSFRTAARYGISLIETDIVKKQTRQRLEDRRRQVREQRADIMRRRESDDPADAEAARQEELPNPDDVEEMDIEVPGWESKGLVVLGLDLFTDFIKLGIYSAFFAILMMFYGLPIHIMRDLFLTARSFVKRLGALLRYRKVLQDMQMYPDATEEELARENTCIICREDMRPWDPNSGAIETSRPKKLPCGHILHFGCLKNWIERQQVCPTCRRPVVVGSSARIGDAANAAAAPRANAQHPQAGQAAPENGPPDAGRGNPGGVPGNMRVFQLGPLRLGFGNGQNINLMDMAQAMRNPQAGAGNIPAPTPAPPTQAPGTPADFGNNDSGIQAQVDMIYDRIQRDITVLQNTQAEMQTLRLLLAELERLRQLRQQPQQPGMDTPTNLGADHLSLEQQIIQQHQQALDQQYSSRPPAFPFPSSFAPVHARSGTPSMARHQAAPNAAAIPAGSPQLPEGMVIPPGWSLLPLQRLEAQGSQGGQTYQSAAPPSDVTNNSPFATVPPTNIQSHFASTIPEPSSVATETPREPPQQASRNVSEGSRVGVSGPATAAPEPPVVAAPTPVVPNWGGAAQLFANGDAGQSSTDASKGLEQHTDSSDEEEDEESDDDTKGKAKAVTVEDAEDDSTG